MARARPGTRAAANPAPGSGKRGGKKADDAMLLSDSDAEPDAFAAGKDRVALEEEDGGSEESDGLDEQGVYDLSSSDDDDEDDEEDEEEDEDEDLDEDIERGGEIGRRAFFFAARARAASGGGGMRVPGATHTLPKHTHHNENTTKTQSPSRPSFSSAS